MSALRLIVGLGNPGAEHRRTRHNAGFWFVDALARQTDARFGIDAKLRGEIAKCHYAGQTLWLLKPTTFMNASGASVGAALRYWKIAPEEMLVAHDDLDLPPGAARLKFDGGHGGQNGIRDILAHAGTPKFHRLRLGIGHPGKGDSDRVTPWVLGRPSIADENLILDAIGRAFDVLPLAVNGEFEKAMLQLHSKAEGLGARG
jgi:peptidyl-tRNA hydrolase, PTH1 family